MNPRAAWVLTGILLVGGYTAVVVLSPAGPPEVRITPPAPDLAPRLAGLSGAWEVSEGRPGQLVVERVNETRAVIVHFWEHELPGHPTAGWERVVARVQRDGTIQWGYPVRFALRLAEDGATLETETERAGDVVRTTLTKVSAMGNPSGATPHAILTKAVQQAGEATER